MRSWMALIRNYRMFAESAKSTRSSYAISLCDRTKCVASKQTSEVSRDKRTLRKDASNQNYRLMIKYL